MLSPIVGGENITIDGNNFLVLVISFVSMWDIVWTEQNRKDSKMGNLDDDLGALYLVFVK